MEITVYVAMARPDAEEAWTVISAEYTAGGARQACEDFARDRLEGYDDDVISPWYPGMDGECCEFSADGISGELMVQSTQLNTPPNALGYPLVIVHWTKSIGTAPAEFAASYHLTEGLAWQVVEESVQQRIRSGGRGSVMRERGMAIARYYDEDGRFRVLEMWELFRQNKPGGMLEMIGDR